MPIKAKFTVRYSYLVSFGLTLIIFALHQFHVVDFKELDAIDWRFRLSGVKEAHQDITLVEIDDPSVAAIGEWPWPRGRHSLLLDIIGEFNPRSVFFDILFTEKSLDPVEDEKLRKSVASLGNVVLPFYYHSLEPFGAFFPIPSLREAARASGFVNVVPDRDGVTRKIRISMKTEEGTFFHPAVLMRTAQFTDNKEANKWFRSIPADKDGNIWVNYPGPLSAFKRVSFTDVIKFAVAEDRESLEKYFTNKMVIVGHTATGTTDLRPTPFSPIDLGVSIQASALHTILTDKYLKTIHWSVHLLILLVLSLPVVWVVRTQRMRWGGVVTIGAMLAYSIFNFLAFLLWGLLLPSIVPLVVLGFSYLVCIIIKFLSARFEGELITRELNMAARIQEALLPKGLPEKEELDVAFKCKFVKAVGGDLYDWVDLGESRLGLCIGDVSGKGVPAALYMAKAISEFRREKKEEAEPGDICGNLNTSFANAETAGMFLTFHYAIIDTQAKTMRYAVAGHDPMVYYSAGEKSAKIIEADAGLPLGLFAGGDYPTTEMTYQADDMFFLISDGVKELRNPKAEEFGMERLREVVEKSALEGLDAEGVIKQVEEAMVDFQKGSAAHDDRTMVCLRFKA